MSDVAPDEFSNNDDQTGAPRWGLLLIALLVAAYIPVFSAGFIWQDDSNITYNLSLRRAEGLQRIWVDPSASPRFGPGAYTLLWVEHRLFGDEPSGYHVISLLLHIANALLLWTLLRRLDIRGAWLAAAIFGLHPAQTAAVASVSECGIVLATMFYMIALLGYGRLSGVIPPVEDYEDRWLRFGLPQRPVLRYTMVLVLAAAAMLCHPGAVTFPIAVLLIIWIKRGVVTRADVKPLLVFLGVALAVIGWTFWSGIRADRFEEITRTALASPSAVCFATAKLLFPLPAVVNYTHSNFAFAPPAQIVTALVLLVGVSALWRYRNAVGIPFVAGILFFVTQILIDAALRRPLARNAPFTDLPYAACIAPVALIASGLIDFTNLAARGSAVVLRVTQLLLPVGLTIATWFMAGRYVDEKTYWDRAVMDDPAEAFAHYRLGVLAMRDAHPLEAVKEFSFATHIDPDDVTAATGLARAYESLGRFAEAQRVYADALKRQPRNVQLLIALASFEVRRGDLSGAIEHYSAAVAAQPDNAVAHHNLGTALARAGRVDEAQSQYEESLRLNPDAAPVHVSLANLLFLQRQYDKAAEHLQEAVKHDPLNFDAYRTSGVILMQHQEYQKAEASFRSALAIRPDSLEALNGLVAALTAQGGHAPEAAFIAKKIEGLKSRPRQTQTDEPKNIEQLWRPDLGQ